MLPCTLASKSTPLLRDSSFRLPHFLLFSFFLPNSAFSFHFYPSVIMAVGAPAFRSCCTREHAICSTCPDIWKQRQAVKVSYSLLKCWALLFVESLSLTHISFVKYKNSGLCCNPVFCSFISKVQSKQFDHLIPVCFNKIPPK